MAEEVQNEKFQPEQLLAKLDAEEFLEAESREGLIEDTRTWLNELKEEIEGGTERGLDLSVARFLMLLRDMPSNMVVFTDSEGRVVHGPVRIPDKIYRFRRQAGREAFLEDWKKRKKKFAKKPLLWEYRVWKRDKMRQYEQTLARWVDAQRKKLKKVMGKVVYPEAYVGKMNSHEFLWKNAAASVSKQNRESRYSYVREKLSQSSLPSGWHNDILALVAHESGFQDKALSNKGARGAWQLMPKTARKMGLQVREETIKGKRVLAKEWFTDPKDKQRKWKWVYRPAKKEIDERTNFTAATEAGIKYLELLYGTISDNRNIKRIIELYEVDFDEFAKYLVLNGYNSGEGLILKMARWFLHNYSPEKVEKMLGYKPDADDLFNFMIYRFTEYQRSGFKREQRDYIASILALKQLAPAELFEKGPFAMH